MLESRALLAAVAWDGGGDGTSWTDAVNWSNNVVPGAADDVMLSVVGTPTIVVQGDVGTINSLDNREIIRLLGAGATGNALLTVTNAATNRGKIIMETIDDTWSSTLVATNGTLTNISTGVIDVNSGAGGIRNIDGNLRNLGTIDVEAGVRLDLSGVGKRFTQAAGTVTGEVYPTAGSFAYQGGNISAGDIQLFDSQIVQTAVPPAGGTVRLHGVGNQLLAHNYLTLWIEGRGAEGDAALTVPGTVSNFGTIHMQSSNDTWPDSLVVAAGGLLTNAASGTISSSAGTGGSRTIIGDVTNVGNIGSVDYLIDFADGTLTSSGGTYANVTARNAALAQTASPSSPTTLRLAGDANTIVSDTFAGMTYWINGANDFGPAAVTSANGFNNNGTLLFESSNDIWPSALTIASGTLENGPTGVIRSEVGSGGDRIIDASLCNHGRLEVNQSLSLGNAGAKHQNLGEIVLDGGASLTSIGESAVNRYGAFIGGNGSLNEPIWLGPGTKDLVGPSLIGVTLQPNKILVHFESASNFNVASVTNLANYKLFSSGLDGNFNDGDIIDISSRIIGITYSAAVKTATITLAPVLALNEAYLLRIRGQNIVSNGAPLYTSNIDVIRELGELGIEPNNLIRNGSFEIAHPCGDIPQAIDVFETLGQGSTAIRGWEVIGPATGPTIDWITDGHFQASEGVLSVDLNGTSGFLNNFKSTFEGWTANGGTLTHNAGEYLVLTDNATSNMRVDAPLATWNGGSANYSNFNGGRIVFSAREFTASGSNIGNFGTVSLKSGSDTISKDAAPGVDPGNTWETYDIQLTAAAFGVTEQRWQNLLADLQSVSIFLDSGSGTAEVIGFDNFQFVTANTGGIRQYVATTPGVEYFLTFDMGGNPRGELDLIRRLQVRASDPLYAMTVSQNFEVDLAATTVSDNPEWATKHLTFTATSTTTVLEFLAVEPKGSFFGAVLDHVVLKKKAAAAFVELPSGGGSYELVADGAEIVVRVVAGAELFRGSPTSLDVNGSASNDYLRINFSGGNPLAITDVAFNGGGQGAAGDQLLLSNGVVAINSHTFKGSNSGELNVNGGVLSYQGLERPISDMLIAATREFILGDGNDSVTLGPDAGNVANVSRVSRSGGAIAVDFREPTTALAVFGMGGDDAISVVADGPVQLIGITLDGGQGNDTLTADKMQRAVTLLGNAGNDVAIGGTSDDVLEGGGGNDSLQGGTGNDRYVFDADVALGTDILVEALGDDTLDFSGTSTKAIAINLSLAGSQAINSNLTLTLSAGNTFEHVKGGRLGDSLTGNTLVNHLEGGPGSDTLDGASGNDLLAGGTDSDSLAGGVGNDSYLFDVDGSLGADTIIDTSGSDTLDFSATNGQAVNVNLGIAGSQTVHANLSLTLSTGHTVRNAIGGDLGDQLFGDANANVLTGGKGNDTLAGGAGNDSYRFDVDGLLGADTITDTSGSDTLDFSATNGQAVNVNLGIAGSQTVHANLSLTLSAGHTVRNAIGGDLGDQLFGDANANVLTGGKGNDTLAGGAGNDTYAFDADAALGTDTIIEAASGGTDTLDFTTTTTQTIALDLSNDGLQSINAFLSIDLSPAIQFENAKGGAQSNSITGNDLANNLTGGASADTLVGGLGNDTLAGLGGNDSLQGSAGDDSYTFDIDGQLGTDTIVETPTGGIDTLNFSSSTTQAATLNLGLAAQQTVHGTNHMLTLGASDVIENAIGTSKDDFLTGNNLANTLTGGPGNDGLSGGAGDDVYSFDADAALGVDTLNESVGGGIDLLDFSQTTGVGIVLDLASVATQALNARLSLNLSSAAGFEMVVGTSMNDTLRGNDENNVLIGGAGADSIQGFGGRDLLVGGSGADSLQGGDEEDILISGKLTYFDETTKSLNRLAIDALMAEWTRINANSAYAQRIANLRAGVGPGATFKISSATAVTDGIAIDSLFGQNGLDWFWRFGNDTIGDLHTGGAETVN